MTNKEIFAYLRQNKNILKMAKKSVMKKADGVAFNNNIAPNLPPDLNIALKSEQNDFNKLNLSVVVNTSNILDSHGDVHIDNIWKKSLNGNKDFYLLQEHLQIFKGVINDKMTAKVEKLSFKDLGFEQYAGNTDALIFEGNLEKNDNPYMFLQYKNKKVKQHSVGMFYVNLFLCMNSDDKYDIEERENYEKYISHIANKDDFEDIPYFWAVTEAKIIEGSAVLFGSNPITPTNFIEPLKNTQLNEPIIQSTQKQKTGWEIFKY